MAKNKNAMTRNERKDKNRPDEQKKEKKGLTPKTKKIMAITALCLAVVLIANAIMIPLLMPPSFGTNNPVARIQIVIDGRRQNLDIELLPEQAPIGVANFMFLARYGFFDNTIISDVGGPRTGTPEAGAGHGFFRFAGFESPRQSRTNRGTNQSFYDDFPLLRDDRAENKMGYVLRQENTNATAGSALHHETQFNLSWANGWGNSLTMQIAALPGANSMVTRNVSGSPPNMASTGSVFGRVLGESSRRLAMQIAEAARAEVIEGQAHTFFNHPASTITIRRVRLYQRGNWRMTADRFLADVISEINPSWTANNNTII